MTKNTNITYGIIAVLAMLIVIPFAYAQVSDDFYDTITEISKKYGIPEYPVLTESQHIEHEAKISKLYEAQGTISSDISKLYEVRDAISSNISKLYAEEKSIFEEIAAVDKSYGIAPWPVHDNITWDKYNAEIDTAYKSYERKLAKQILEQQESELEVDAIGKLFAEYDFVLPQYIKNHSEEFILEASDVFGEYAHELLSFADQTVPTKDKLLMYDIISNKVIPKLQKIYENHGHDAPPSITAQQVQDMEKKIMQIRMDSEK